MSSERAAAGDHARFRVDARVLPFTPSWFWEVIDTAEGTIVENSLALSRAVYRSSAEALSAGHEFVGWGVRDVPPQPPVSRARSSTSV